MLQIPCPFLGPEALSFTVPLILGTPLTVSWTLYSLVIFCLFFFFKCTSLGGLLLADDTAAH